MKLQSLINKYDAIKRIEDHFEYFVIHVKKSFFVADSVDWTYALSETMSKPVLMINNTHDRYEMIWLTKGFRYNPFGGPSGYSLDKRNSTWEQAYTDEKGFYHNQHGPAYSCCYGDTMGSHRVVHTYYHHGEVHRDDGPAKLTMDADHMEVSYMMGGKPVPSPIFSRIVVDKIEDNETDNLLNMENPFRAATVTFFAHVDANGMRDRKDGPAFVQLNDVRLTYKDGHVNIIKYDGWKTRWIFNDVVVSNATVKAWCKERGILLSNKPGFDGSAFLRSDDELAFRMNFASKY